MGKKRKVRSTEIFPILTDLVKKAHTKRTGDSLMINNVKRSLPYEHFQRFKTIIETQAGSKSMLASVKDIHFKKLCFLPQQLRKVSHQVIFGR
ncbi:hypothetical protein DPMN_099333 [Dreissena polymorpha]|uniref:Uncharacterized protein n=1 Tax=Dreissena polymorpha TaxID=45954 RepID=A0A9D4R835_DREPO|nr:hypothetical protein DPMN_099333 [Dreissena polymorpha]